MPILEILRLGYRNSGPPHLSATQRSNLIKTLSDARAKLKTNSRFYQGVDDETTILIFGQWASLAAHEEFLASDRKEEVLREQETMLSFGEMRHVEGAVSDLPLEAPVMAVQWYSVPEERRLEFEKAVERWKERAAAERGKLGNLVAGWSVDPPRLSGEGVVGRYVLCTGWENPDAYERFAGRAMEQQGDGEGLLNVSEGANAFFVKDLELGRGM